MRDVERLREKNEFALDDRQIAGLLAGALLLFGAVFALGLLVGKHLAAQTQPALATTELVPVERKPTARLPEPPAPPAKQAVDAPPPAPKQAAAVVPAPKPAVIVPPPPRPVSIPAAAAPPAALAPPPGDPGDFTIQVGASKDRVEAQRLVQRARAAGLKAYVTEAELGEKGTWYRVRVGAFKDKDSASRFRHDVERELRVAAVVMSTH
jgi:cell division septation protein DedD